MGNECSHTNQLCKVPPETKCLGHSGKLDFLKRRNSQTIEGFHNLLNHVSQRNWAAREDSFLCTEKFFLYYKEYLRDQTFVSEIWNNAQVADESPRESGSEFSSEFKFLIRTGVPLDNFRVLILEIFKKASTSNALEYECALKVAFPGSLPETFKNVPLFSYSRQLEDILPVNFLNAEGLETFKRIMWVYEKNISMLEYSPLLSQTVALLLLFLKEDETYCVVKTMLETSAQLLDTKDGHKGLKWHLTLTRDQFDVFLESLSSFLKDRPNDLLPLWKHFKKINYDCNDLFWQLTKTLFLGYLPLSTSLKIFMAYLNEGIRIYGRFTLALLKLFQNDILLCTNSQSILSVIKDKCANITKSELQTLITTAYELRLGQLKQRISTIQPQTFHSPESTKLYYPQLCSHSSVTASPSFETIWEWLPNDLKLANPTLAYCSKVHGWSLNTLYLKCSKMHHYRGVLLLIKTTDSVTLGAFIDGMILPHNRLLKSIGSNESFVFQLNPNEKKYNATSTSNEHMICNREFISIGAGNEGPAIYLQSDLLRGSSHRSDTYGNEPLCQTNEKNETSFECYAVEVYWIN